MPRFPPWVRISLRLAVTGGLLVAILQFVSLGDVAAAIGSARPEWLAAAVPLILAAPFLSAVRLRLLLSAQGPQIRLSEIVRINFATSFWVLALPGTLAGGPIRWFKLSRAGGGTMEPAAAIIYSRIAYMAGMALLGVLFVLAEVPRGVTWVAVASLVLFLGIVVTLAGLATRAGRWKLVRRLSARKEGLVARVVEAAGRYRHLSGRERAYVLALAVAENLVGTVVLFFLALGLGLELAFVTLGWVRSVVKLLMSLPVTISGLGIREGGLMIALEPYGVAGPNALALSLLLLATSLLVGAVGGALELHTAVTGGGVESPREADAG